MTTSNVQRWNALTHFIGLILSLIGTYFLIQKGQGSPLATAAYGIYGLTMCLMYLFSTLYHSFCDTKWRPFLRKLDHSSIFLLIAGTYTPFSLIGIQGKFGWFIFIIQWIIAFGGILLKFIALEKMSKISSILYILMGWFAVIALPQIVNKLAWQAIFWLFLGGVTYTVGVFFYRQANKAYTHVIWHLFVMVASLFMFISIYVYL